MLTPTRERGCLCSGVNYLHSSPFLYGAKDLLSTAGTVVVFTRIHRRRSYIIISTKVQLRRCFALSFFVLLLHTFSKNVNSFHIMNTVHKKSVYVYKTLYLHNFAAIYYILTIYEHIYIRKNLVLRTQSSLEKSPFNFFDHIPDYYDIRILTSKVPI